MTVQRRVPEFAADGKHNAARARAQAKTRAFSRRGWALLVAAGLMIVHAGDPSCGAAAGDKPAAAPAPAAKAQRAYTGALPPNVIEMREQILAAVHSGDIGELKGAIEWNEIKPDFGPSANDDPIAAWTRMSADGAGREVLAALANALALPPARLAIGKDPENNQVYVWPYLAELPLDTLSPAEEVDLYRLMAPAAAKSMRSAKKWTWWRIAIGADGTWHTFRKFD